MWQGRGGKKGLYIVTERFHCPRLPSISGYNRPFGGGGAPWQRPLTPGQSKHDSSLKYTDTTERRPTLGSDTDTEKDTLPSGSGLMPEVGVNPWAVPPPLLLLLMEVRRVRPTHYPSLPSSVLQRHRALPFNEKFAFCLNNSVRALRTNWRWSST